MATNAPWSGQWVADRLGVALHGDGLHDLLGLALRRNPKRAHLLVSHVLGKHIPQRPDVVYGHGYELGERVRDLLGPDEAARAVVLGYAETATGLGHAVADGLGAVPYLHSTRRRVPGTTAYGGFEEEHSHATGHLLLPEDPALLTGPGPLVLVDDEFSTGQTVLNTIRALHDGAPRDRYVVVALTDMRAPADRARLDAFAAELGARIDLVALAGGTVTLPEGVLAAGQALVAAHERAGGAGGRDSARPPAAASVRRVELGWPDGLPDGGRHGFLPRHRESLAAALPAMGERLAAALPPTARRVLVLGNEELMYAPLRLAQALQDALTAAAPQDPPAGPRPAPRCSTPPPPARPCSPSTTPGTRSAAGSSSPPTTGPPTTGPATGRGSGTPTTWPAPDSTPWSPSWTPSATPPNCTPPAACWPNWPRTRARWRSPSCPRTDRTGTAPA